MAREYHIGVIATFSWFIVAPVTDELVVKKKKINHSTSYCLLYTLRCTFVCVALYIASCTCDRPFQS